MDVFVHNFFNEKFSNLPESFCGDLKDIRRFDSRAFLQPCFRHLATNCLLTYKGSYCILSEPLWQMQYLMLLLICDSCKLLETFFFLQRHLNRPTTYFVLINDRRYYFFLFSRSDKFKCASHYHIELRSFITFVIKRLILFNTDQFTALQDRFDCQETKLS